MPIRKRCKHLRETETRIETDQPQSNTGIETDLEEVEAKDLEANAEEMRADR
jgi:hypothetical protein